LVQRTLRSQTCELGVPGRIEPCERRLDLAKTDHSAHALAVSTDEAGPLVHENRLDPRAEPLERAPHLSGNGETAELTEHEVSAATQQPTNLMGGFVMSSAAFMPVTPAFVAPRDK
jgi:hypothetical protein